MLRHAIAPARFFSQVPNEIIRHPRLSSDAVRLLTWQLSLPADAADSLSKTAQSAGIGKAAFLRAKRQLKDEGYVHEWREQVERGRWRTRQLVSNVPLSRDEAARVSSGSSQVGSSQVGPTDVVPAVGAPTGRDVGRLPDQTPVGNTLQPSPDARRAVDSLHRLDPRLRVPRAILPELAALAEAWLDAGYTVEGVTGRGPAAIAQPGSFHSSARRACPVRVAGGAPCRCATSSGCRPRGNGRVCGLAHPAASLPARRR